MSIKYDYVAGFLFSENLLNVALIQKQKPEWQKGKLNAIGGKIEDGESPEDAMRREFLEETGLDVSEWKRFCVLRGENEGTWRVHFFYAIGDIFKIKQMEVEKPFIVPARDIGSWLWKTIPNLSWLVPMAINFASDKENCAEFQVIEV